MSRLRTNSHLSVQSIRELLDKHHARKFVWVQSGARSYCPTAKEQARLLDLSKYMPEWFRLLTNPEKMVGVQQEECRVMISSILKGSSLDMITRGLSFGYSANDITWYARQVREAAERAAAFFGGEPEDFLS